MKHTKYSVTQYIYELIIKYNTPKYTSVFCVVLNQKEDRKSSTCKAGLETFLSLPKLVWEAGGGVLRIVDILEMFCMALVRIIFGPSMPACICY